ncbi:hypothetical protein GHT06_015991 [Daphnia sinensis]|uniref:Uncharacterized protein n=1 Tax=Daphnia sinensis TaxID=1820382 RepID=A0AAD5PTX6_9CRUS|nr:hypothetical protein GHT06_015991 [Daphnia sinensis]
MCVDLMSREISPPEKELITYSSVLADTEYMATPRAGSGHSFSLRFGDKMPPHHGHIPHGSRDPILLGKLAVHDIKRFPLVRRSSRPSATFIMQNRAERIPYICLHVLLVFVLYQDYAATFCQQNLSRRYDKVLIRNDCLPSLCALAAAVLKRGSSANSAGH